MTRRYSLLFNAIRAVLQWPALTHYSTDTRPLKKFQSERGRGGEGGRVRDVCAYKRLLHVNGCI